MGVRQVSAVSFTEETRSKYNMEDKRGIERAESESSGGNLEELTALDIVSRQRQLEREAARRFPWDPKECTHHLNLPERQTLFACLTCLKSSKKRNAICYACSLRCHAEHELVELWSKRGFFCDCGTSRIDGAPCRLRHVDELEPCCNPESRYNHNFDGYFCSCNERSSDGTTGVMYQCLLGAECGEDWFHARCIVDISLEEENRRNRSANLPSEKYSLSVNLPNQVVDEHNVVSTVHTPFSSESEEDSEDSQSDEETTYTSDIENCSGTFPELPSPFKSFVCSQCVGKLALDTLIPRDQSLAVFFESTSDSTAYKAGQKRPSSGKVHMFLKQGYEELFSSLARDSPRMASLVQMFPVLRAPESTYMPPLDSDAKNSLIDAGERALQSLPHEQVVDGIEAYSVMKDKLASFLAPFAVAGRVVTQSDVKSFFDSM